MNKKFLSAALFGALLASTAGTFTSCKDYDDDINGLTERVDAVEKSLSELNTKFGALAYVKSVSFANGKLTVTDQSGTPTVYDIPDKDTNTTYTMSVSQDGNKATITLTPSDGSAQSITVSFTDTDTNTQLDPTMFWMDEAGVVWYGPKATPDKCTKTGIQVPMHEKTTVTVVKKEVNGAVIGWDIKVDEVTTTLNIQDVLPITGFSWIPESYYNGIEAVDFPSYAYNAVTKGASTDTTYVRSTATLSSFPAIAKFHLNPASATLAQIKGGAKGATMLYKGAVDHTTRSAEINPKATLAYDDETGILLATITADMNKAETAADKLDMLALRLTTTAGNTFTSSYFAAYNSKKDVVFTLVDKHDLTNNTIAAEHALANKWSVVKDQAAQINSDNAPLETNAHLVQVLGYDEAIKGVDLNTLVNLAITKDGKSEKLKLAENNLSAEYVLCKYDVNGTDQINYATLTGSKLTAINYEQTDYACIGKSPVVKVTVKDTNNNDAVVAVGYIKLLYVANKMEVSDDFTAPVNSKTFDWKCFNSEELDYTTTVEYMSTQVYPKVGSELGLNALSKEQFVANYTFVADQANIPAVFKSKHIVGITEIVGADNNADNRQVKYAINESEISKIAKDGTYTFYGVYKKNADASKVSSLFYQYPVYVAIPYTITIQKYPTVANGLIKDTKSSRIGQAWEGDVVTSKGSKGSTGRNGSALYLDVAEAIDFTKYGAHILEIENPTTGAVAMTGEEWCGGHGSADWIVLKKQLINDEVITVPVIVKQVLCNGDAVVADKIYVKFMNPSKLALAKTSIDLKDQLSPSTTEDLKKLIKITSSKDGSTLYEKSALTDLGKKILGEDVVITLSKGTVTPIQWADKFAWDNNTFKMTWLLDGQNTLAPGQKATCEMNITVVYGKVKASEALSGCTIETALGGSKLTGKVTVNALNAADYDAKYNK